MGMKHLLAASVLAASAGTTSAQPRINEFEPNPGGSSADPLTQQIELIGTPLSPFVGVLVAIDSDEPQTTSVSGKINRIIPINSSFDANGLLVITVNDMENPSLTLVLADSYTGNTLTDLDVNDDGTIDDLSFFGTVFDAIGIPGSVADETWLYGSGFGGQDFSYTGANPAHIFRDARTGEWYARNDLLNEPDDEELFDLSATNVPRSDFELTPDPTITSFGSANAATVAPVLIGDFDGDGDVDGVDIAEMFSNFNGPGGGAPANPDTDLDADGDVDGVDIASLFGAFTGPLSPTTVPEPSGLALLALGGVLITRRK